MIELPSFATVGAVSPRFIDAGFTQRGIQSIDRIDRKGSRYAADFAYGPFHPEQGRVMVSRLIAGKQEGMRVKLPLLHNQGSPGAALTSGAVVQGRTLPLDGLTPGYTCKEGYWLSIEVSGQHYLHNVRTGGTADGSGALSVTLAELVRVSIPDNATVHLAKPMLEGLVIGEEAQWGYAVDRMIPIEFSIEEAA